MATPEELRVQRFDEICGTAMGTRVWGLVVLVCALAMGLWLLFEGGAPTLTWVILGIFVVISGWASIHNFGDRWHVTDEGLSYRNTLTALVGLPRERSVAWSEVTKAAEYEGRTWFLSIEGQKRWVLDHLADHDRLGLILRELDVPVSTIEKPKPFSRDGRDPGAPR